MYVWLCVDDIYMTSNLIDWLNFKKLHKEKLPGRYTVVTVSCNIRILIKRNNRGVKVSFS